MTAEGPHLSEAAEGFITQPCSGKASELSHSFLVDLLQSISCAVHQSDPQNPSHHVERAGHHFCVMVEWVEPVGAEIMTSLCSE